MQKVLASLISLSVLPSIMGSGGLKISGLEGREHVPCTFYDIRGYAVVPAANLTNGEPNLDLNHWGPRPDGDLGNVQALVMHYTVGSLKSTLQWFCGTPYAESQVSAHYVVTETEKSSSVEGGQVIEVVPEAMRAWHAGPSEWRDIVCDTRNGKSRGLNSSSIGIENVNKGFTEAGGVRTWYSFDPEQINALGLLSLGIVARWGIHPANVVGHSDICPGIKSDPGVLFPWGELYYRHGVGAWLTQDELLGRFSENVIEKEPLPQGVSAAYLLSKLREYGYTGIPEGSGELTPELVSTLTAFQMHFSANQQPHKLDGQLSREDMIWAHGLTAKYPRSNREDVQESLE